MHIFSLVAIGLILILFKATRFTGIAGLTLLSLLYPLLFVALLVIGSAIFCVYHFHIKE